MVVTAKFRRRFCTMRAADYPRFEGSRRVSLCSTCSNYFDMTPSTKNVREQTAVIWPALIWSILSNVDLRNEYGEHIWSIVPTLWRPWWLDEVKKLFVVMQNVTISQPPASIKDVTVPRHQIEIAKRDLRIVEIRDVYDRWNYPCVRCPWGCT